MPGPRYFRRPELTEQRFIADPRAREPGARLYKTGDRARYRADGSIEFLGRADHQVKLRGFRIELGEIEAVLTQHPDIAEAVVTLREDTPGDRRLVAYLVAREGTAPEATELRGHLQSKLPDYMVPPAFVWLSAMPLSPNGKVDRKALPAPESTRSEQGTTLLAPRDTVELALVRIWEDTLAIRPVGVRDDFFALGGHSLLAVRLMTRIKEHFGRALPLATLLQAATVEAMALKLREEESSKPWSPLVLIQPSGQGRPVFFVHPLGGMVLCFADLARHLGTARPFYGFQGQGFDDEQAPLARIEDMAAQYIQAMRQVQPEGPYLLGGWSFGGIVAFEMAQQLLRDGHAVDLLAMLDSACPEPDLLARSYGLENEWFILTVLARGLGVDVLEEELSGLDAETRISHARSLLSRARIVSPGLNMDRLGLAIKMHVQAMYHYTPRIYPGRITLFRATQKLPPMFGQTSPDLGPTHSWGKYASQPIDVYDMPGDHLSMAFEPHVQTLAAQLAQCLLAIDPPSRDPEGL